MSQPAKCAPPIPTRQDLTASAVELNVDIWSARGRPVRARHPRKSRKGVRTPQQLFLQQTQYPNEFVGFAASKKRMRGHPNLIRGYGDFELKNARQKTRSHVWFRAHCSRDLEN